MFQRSRKTHQRRRNSAHNCPNRPLAIEPLEARQLLAVTTVDTELDIVDPDDGDTSLREAIIAANALPGNDEIVFDFNFNGPATIVLEQGQLEITDALEITGDGRDLLAIDAVFASRVFDVTAPIGDVTLSGMTLMRGKTTGDNATFEDATYSGGAIRSLTTGRLTLDDVVVTRSSTEGRWAGGGAIWASRELVLNNASLTDNSTGGVGALGGAIWAGGDVTITDTTINGNSTSGGSAEGGAIYGEQRISVTRSTLSDNNTTGEDSHGGALRASDDVSLVDSTLSNNSVLASPSRGGGLFVDDGSVIATNTTIIGNTAVHGGGGIFAERTIELNSSTVVDNQAGDRGGGVSARTVNLNDSTVSDNRAGNVDGGIEADGHVNLTRSTVSGNLTTGNESQGGGIYSHGAATIIDSTVSGNRTSGSRAHGAGIFVDEAINLSNSTVSGNNATGQFALGGGIYVNRGNLGGVNMNNSTLALNHASSGGGIWNINDLHSTISIVNSIVAGNTADLRNSNAGPDIKNGAGEITVNYSIIGDADGLLLNGRNILVGVDPLLGPLTQNGGPTQTHGLLPGSPAINAGDPNAAAGASGIPLYDQRLSPYPRVYDDRIDIGAVEQQPQPADFNGDNLVSGADFLAWQRGYGIESPHAAKGDGDADSDQDVDAHDLELWSASFGLSDVTSTPVTRSESSHLQPILATAKSTEILQPTYDIGDVDLIAAPASSIQIDASAAQTPVNPLTPQWVVDAADANDEGQSSARVEDAAVAPNGDVVLYGELIGTMDFDPGPGELSLTSAGGRDLFIATYSPSGALVSANTIGGADTENAGGLSIDSAGNRYISSWYDGQLTVDGQALPPSGYANIFVSKINPAGDLQWTTSVALDTYSGLNGRLWAYDLVVSDPSPSLPDGAVYITGNYWGSGQIGPAAVNGSGGYISRLNAASGAFEWTEILKGSIDHGPTPQELALDDSGSGDLIVAGPFSGRLRLGDTTLRSGGDKYTGDLFVTRMTSNGDFLWAREFGSAAHDGVNGLTALDGNVYMAGNFQQDIDFDATTLTSAGFNDGFVIGLDSSGGALWAQRFGGTENDSANVVVAIAETGVVVGGSFSGTADFSAQILASAGSGDGALAQLDPASGAFVDSWRLGGIYGDSVRAMAIGGGGVYAAGEYVPQSADFPTGDAPTDELAWRAYLMKLSAADESNSPPVADAGGPYSGTEDVTITLDASGSTDADGDVLTYLWNFGDGDMQSTSSPIVTYSYQWGGNFDVSLTVSDGRGGADTVATTTAISEVNDVPLADAGEAYSGVENEAVGFDASASSDFDNVDGTTANDQLLEYTWDFGDGTPPVTTSSPTLNHTYAGAGNYNVTLTVSDGVANSAADVVTATISTAPVGSVTDLYIWDIDFKTKNRGRHTDLRVMVDVNSDSNADGIASGADAAAVGALVTIELRNSSGNLVGTYSGTTNSSGVFQTAWIRGLAHDDYTANVVDLALAGYTWDPFDLDGEDDTDGDGWPDDVFALL